MQRAKSLPIWLPILANWALYFAIQLLNQQLAKVQIWLYLDGLFLVFSLFYLRFRHALILAAVLGLLIDAWHPVPYGTRMILYSIALVCLLPLRLRLRRENPVHLALAGLALNVIIFIGLAIVSSVAVKSGGPGLGLRLFTDIALSALVFSFVASPWALAQRKLIVIVSGRDPAGQPILNVW